jgi:hypothetical protein
MLEYDFKMYDGNKQLITVSTSSIGAPWIPRWMGLVYMAVGRRGGCLDAAEHLYYWVKDIPVFTDVVHHEFWIPASPWLPGDDPETNRLNEIGAHMRDDIKVGPVSFLRDGILVAKSFD